MGFVENFEDLKCWKKARKLVALVYENCETGRLAKDFETRAQLKRAALSVMNNIAEGFGRRYSNKEFILFLRFSQSSAQEVKSISYVLEDVQHIPVEQAKLLRDCAEEVKRMVLALIRHLNSR